MKSGAAVRIGRFGWVVLMLIGVALIVALYFVKTRAAQARAHVRTLEHTLDQEQAGVRILNAEIAHLENPERLRTLSQQHLELEPVNAERVLTIEEAVKVLPKREDSQEPSNGGAND